MSKSGHKMEIKTRRGG